jgi:hypothetical protein
MMRGRTTRLSLALLGALVFGALGAYGMSGCGGKDSSSGGVATGNGSSAPKPSATASAAADLTKFAECMRDNGVDLPDPDPNTGRIDIRRLRGNNDPKFQHAMEQCRSLLVGAAGGQQLTPAEIEQLRQFAKCMRDNGVDLPDPDPGGGLFTAMGKLDRNSPIFQKAMQSCASKLPQSITGGGSGS